MTAARSAGSPVGVFDSGVGGLSVLRHIRAQLPNEHLIYFADSGHAPYGDKTEEYVVERALAVSDFLLKQGMKALVVACKLAPSIAGFTSRLPTCQARLPEILAPIQNTLNNVIASL